MHGLLFSPRPRLRPLAQSTSGAFQGAQGERVLSRSFGRLSGQGSFPGGFVKVLVVFGVQTSKFGHISFASGSLFFWGLVEHVSN